ncbi:integrase domain-containing protein [Halomonas vilamensis]|uniref:Integrase domain-containing protein n=1 Tax=Vreelandella vilamensis TaxID=531309 RepID=A0ABU1H940_9GAMM|nr:integrase domain-containing protein [Halomonas vilamensis]MDR5900381.1 integrase domain-containing protein [Halomonas vilamensis]
MAKNFGLGSRDMSKAAQFALNDAVKDGGIGFKHAAEVGREFSKFSEFARANGVKDMQYVNRDLVISYGQQIADRVSNDELKEGTAQNKISAVNTVMRVASGGRWESVSPRHDCGIDQRSAIRQSPPTGLDRSQLERGYAALSERGAAIAELAREFGLRTKESSLLNAQSALREAVTRHVISVLDGTKGGREREIPITSSERQIAF